MTFLRSHRGNTQVTRKILLWLCIYNRLRLTTTFANLSTCPFHIQGPWDGNLNEFDWLSLIPFNGKKPHLTHFWEFLYTIDFFCSWLESVDSKPGLNIAMLDVLSEKRSVCTVSIYNIDITINKICKLSSTSLFYKLSQDHLELFFNAIRRTGTIYSNFMQLFM